MRLVFVNIMRELQKFDSTAYITQPPGDVTENWWLEKESPSSCNHLLPSCLSMHLALRFTAELNSMKRDRVSTIMRIGNRGNGMKFAGTLLYARRQAARQARMLIKQVDRAMGG